MLPLLAVQEDEAHGMAPTKYYDWCGNPFAAHKVRAEISSFLVSEFDCVPTRDCLFRKEAQGESTFPSAAPDS